MANEFDKAAEWLIAKGKTFGVRSTELVGEMALTAGTTVATTTPVDTGRARANWFASTTDDSTIVNDGEDKSGGVSILRIREAVKKLKKGKSIFLFNNLPYVKYLNQGSSKQAPAGFVEKAVQASAKALKAKVL